MENEVEQSEVEEVQTESAPVENEDSTQQTEDAQEEQEEEFVPLERVNEITAQKHNFRRKAEAAEKRAADAEAKLALQAIKSVKKPSLEDVDIGYDDSLYQDKLMDYKLDQRDAQRSAKKNQSAQEQASKDLNDSLSDEVNEYAKKNPKYIESLERNNYLDHSELLHNILVESGQYAKIDHYLLDNPEELSKIENMNTYQKYKHVSKIEASFNKPKTIKKSNASEPIVTVKGTAATPVKKVYKHIQGATFE